MARHVKAKDIAKEFGSTPRHWIKLAASGKIPGAWQTGDEGSCWMFDIEAFRRWQKSKIMRVEEWQGYTKGAKYGGRVSSVKVRNTDVPLGQEIKELLKNAIARG